MGTSASPWREADRRARLEERDRAMELESIRLQYMVCSCTYCSLRHSDSARYVTQIVLVTSYR